MLFRFTILFLFISCLSANGFEANIDSLLQAQRDRGGAFGEHLFDVVDNARNRGLTEEETKSLRFLAAYLPLSDIAAVTPEMLIENVRLAYVAKNRFSWGEQIPEEIFQHFVLPHRISQEPFVDGWRQKFLEEITPRVETLSMSEAALEVNHWCHEKATFKRSSGRDQDPLTTIRAGLGRCEEEMILTIAALRSVGIPARQCYTPYWAHCDNNHAWVEAWADGAWHYMGGCEPKPELDDAWFTKAAGRAMLVVSTAYGEYYGDEPALRRYERSTLLNSTGVYGATRTIDLTLLNAEAEPLDDKRIIFSLFNYGSFMPAAALYTNEEGKCSMVCGNGSWMISAGDENASVLIFNPHSQNEVVLNLTDPDSLRTISQIDYYPPPEVEINQNEAHPPDSLFKRRLALEDSIRNANVWSVWAMETGIAELPDENAKPDSMLLSDLYNSIDDFSDLEFSSVLETMENARGNWGIIYYFITNEFPDIFRPVGIQGGKSYSDSEKWIRWKFITTLTDKDLRDFNLEILTDHFEYSTIDKALTSSDIMNKLDRMDEKEQKRFWDFIVKPRIDWEPSSTWRKDLNALFADKPKLAESRSDEKVIEWIKDNIKTDEQHDRLGSQLTPAATLNLKRGTKRDLERLYIGLCRVRGIPARFNEVNHRLERWSGEKWIYVDFADEEKEETVSVEKGSIFIDVDERLYEEAPALGNQLPESPESWHDVPSDSALNKILYLRDWSVQKWEKDHFSVVDFGYKEPYTKIEWPKKLDPGLYCLTTGFRRKDGSAPVNIKWFEIKENEETHINLKFREQKENQ